MYFKYSFILHKSLMNFACIIKCLLCYLLDLVFLCYMHSLPSSLSASSPIFLLSSSPPLPLHLFCLVFPFSLSHISQYVCILFQDPATVCSAIGLCAGFKDTVKHAPISKPKPTMLKVREIDSGAPCDFIAF